MRIDLRGPGMAMAEELSHCQERDTLPDQVRCEGMSQGMGSTVLDAGAFSCSTNCLAKTVFEKNVFLQLWENVYPLLWQVSQQIKSGLAEWYDSLLSAFRTFSRTVCHFERLMLEIQIQPPQMCKLSLTQPCHGKQLNHRPYIRTQCGNKLLQLFRGKPFAFALFLFGFLNLPHGVVFQVPVLDGTVEQRAKQDSIVVERVSSDFFQSPCLEVFEKPGLDLAKRDVRKSVRTEKVQKYNSGGLVSLDCVRSEIVFDSRQVRLQVCPESHILEVVKITVDQPGLEVSECVTGNPLLGGPERFPYNPVSGRIPKLGPVSCVAKVDRSHDPKLYLVARKHQGFQAGVRHNPGTAVSYISTDKALTQRVKSIESSTAHHLFFSIQSLDWHDYPQSTTRIIRFHMSRFAKNLRQENTGLP